MAKNTEYAEKAKVQHDALSEKGRVEKARVDADVADAITRFNAADDEGKLAIWSENASKSIEHAIAMHKQVARELINVLEREKQGKTQRLNDAIPVVEALTRKHLESLVGAEAATNLTYEARQEGGRNVPFAAHLIIDVRVKETGRRIGRFGSDGVKIDRLELNTNGLRR